jgi:murein DD-endopeptidase MepM/ murein hydrolase activator NlpD
MPPNTINEVEMSDFDDMNDVTDADDDEGDPVGLVRIPGLPAAISPVDDPEIRPDDGAPYGSGEYCGSSENGSRQHCGIDVLTTPGEPIRSMVDGRISLLDPYGDDSKKSGYLHAVDIATDPDPEGDGRQYVLRKSHIDTSGLRNGQRVTAGQVLGPAEDIAAVYPPSKTTGAQMANHMRLEIQPGTTYRRGRPNLNLDPTPLIDAWRRVTGTGR